MSKKYTILVLIQLLISVFLSCDSDDNKAPCEGDEPVGLLETNINGDIIFDASFTAFINLPEGPISVVSNVVDDNCLWRASIGMLIDNSLERQTLLIFEPPKPFKTPTLNFSQIEEDAIIGSWNVIESEDNWLQLEEISANLIKGRFKATLLLRDTGNDFQTLSDTLRLDDVYFEAVLNDFSTR